MRALDEAGRDGTSPAAWKHSFQVQGASAAENYITKWGMAEELTGAQKKSAKGEGLTAWALLRLARTAEATSQRTAADERARFGAIWWEIIKATKGKAQLYKSEGWKELVEAWRAEQPEPEPEPEPEKVKGLGVREKGGLASERFVQARPKLLAVREAAESVDDLGAARRAVDVAIANGPTDYELMDGISDELPDEMVEVIDDGDDRDGPWRHRGDGHNRGDTHRSGASPVIGDDRPASSVDDRGGTGLDGPIMDRPDGGRMRGPSSSRVGIPSRGLGPVPDPRRGGGLRDATVAFDPGCPG